MTDRVPSPNVNLCMFGQGEKKKNKPGLPSLLLIRNDYPGGTGGKKKKRVETLGWGSTLASKSVS